MSMLIRYSSQVGALSSCVHSGRRYFTNLSWQTGNRWAVIRRKFASDVKTVSRAETTTRTGYSAEQLGRVILAGGCVFGIGSLCYYGLGLSGQVGAIDKAGFWPAEVRHRISVTYGYFASGLAVTAAAAYGAMRVESVMRFLVNRPFMSLGVFLVGTLGSSMICHATPYTAATMPIKLGSFAVFSSVMGVTISPLILMAGPIAVRAAAYTAGVVGALTMTAACAPSERYLYMSGPLSLGLGVVLVASIGGMFASPASAIGAGLHSIYMYGGLVLFGGFVLYDTQRIIHSAEKSPTYDPVNMSMGIYMDTINIFIRILMLMMGSGNRRK
ncbi:growth hormone-inducible transmembrane protein-like [Dysidea avara]|uniref:growth hormone-inducible transmembrane protein-like n=1 Tax=Dysidea avara TaxID=196820 RepID=UPI003332F1F1